MVKGLHIGAAMLIAGGIGLGYGPTATAQEFVGSLTIEVNGLRNQEGQVCLKLFDGSRGFPNDDDSAIKRQCVAIASTPLTVTFDDLPFGNYAVALYHDSNSDEQFNRGAFGMPTEGYGFSNDPPAITGPASYGDSTFFVAGASTTIKIQMRYPN